LHRTYVFFFVGADVSQPQMLVESILLVDRQADIVHCADIWTPEISGVTRRVNCQGDRDKLMTFRLKAFSQSGVDRPAIYIDTDMLCVRPIDAVALSSSYPVRFCKREFAVDAAFNGRFGGLDFTEYDQKPLGSVYPFVACATVSPDATLWAEMHKLLLDFDPKFSIWYGDQEAMKRYATLKSLPVEHGLPESQYGCLPEQSACLPYASLIHFKGSARKNLMVKFFQALRGKGPAGCSQ
jgi:hypothetical protein